MRISKLNSCFIVGFYVIFNSIEKTNGNPHRCKNPTLKHGIVQMINGVAQFECMLGYDLLGSLYSRCLNVVWKPDLPVCIKPGCEQIPPLENGEKIYLKSNAHVIFICKTNYTLRGSTDVYCDGNKWSDKIPSCIIDINEYLETFPEQHKDEIYITETTTETESTMMTTLSDLDWYFKRIKLMEEQEKKSTEIQNTKSLKCSRPELLNGDVRLRNDGQMARYICWEGFELLGSRNSYCVDGNWSSAAPFCIKPGCENLPLLENGIELFTKRDALVKFMCKPGYKIDVNKTIHCDGAKWNDTIPICKGECPTPVIANGIIRPRNRGRSIGFKCLKGFKLIGNRISLCLNGKWNEEFPRCVGINPVIDANTESDQLLQKIDDPLLTNNINDSRLNFTELSNHTSTDVISQDTFPKYYSNSPDKLIYLVQDDGSTAKYYLDHIKKQWVHVPEKYDDKFTTQ